MILVRGLRDVSSYITFPKKIPPPLLDPFLLNVQFVNVRPFSPILPLTSIAPLGLGTFTFPVFVALALALGLALGLGSVAQHKRRATALGFTCILTSAWIVGCPPVDIVGPIPGTGPSIVTYRVTLAAVGADEAGTGADASVDNLSRAGTSLSVTR